MTFVLLFDAWPARFFDELNQLDLQGFPPYDTPRHFHGTCNAARTALLPCLIFSGPHLQHPHAAVDGL
jgi:hypothetical protein